MPREGRPITMESQEKARRAADLRIAGMTWHQIAKELGYESESGPRLLVRAYYRRVAEGQHDEMYPILHERGEALWRQSYQAIMEAKRDNDSGKWDRAMQRGQAALTYLARINGLDNGVAVNVNLPASVDVNALRQQFFEIEAAEATLDGEVVEEVDDESPMAPDQHE